MRFYYESGIRVETAVSAQTIIVGLLLDNKKKFELLVEKGISDIKSEIPLK